MFSQYLSFFIPDKILTVFKKSNEINRIVPSLKGKGVGIWLCIKIEKYGYLTYTPPPIYNRHYSLLIRNFFHYTIAPSSLKHIESTYA